MAQTQAAGQIRPWRVRNYVKDTLGIEPYLEVAEPVYVHEAEQYTPHLPPVRVGLKIQADWTPSLSGGGLSIIGCLIEINWPDLKSKPMAMIC